MQTTAVNFKELKLALTVELMNLQKQSNILRAVREFMAQFKEVGTFRDLQVVARQRIDNKHTKRMYALQFEQCQLNLELISDNQTRQQIINKFDLS